MKDAREARKSDAAGETSFRFPFFLLNQLLLCHRRSLVNTHACTDTHKKTSCRKRIRPRLPPSSTCADRYRYIDSGVPAHLHTHTHTCREARREDGFELLRATQSSSVTTKTENQRGRIKNTQNENLDRERLLVTQKKSGYPPSMADGQERVRACRNACVCPRAPIQTPQCKSICFEVVVFIGPVSAFLLFTRRTVLVSLTVPGEERQRAQKKEGYGKGMPPSAKRRGWGPGTKISEACKTCSSEEWQRRVSGTCR